jgi:hypothetical protein
MGKENGFLKLPLPIFDRTFYRLGDVAAGYVIDMNLRSMDSSLAGDVAAQISQALPVDFMGEGGSVSAAFTPDIAKPIAQSITGKDWTGTPLEKPEYYDKHAPKYTRAYDSENQLSVAIAKELNDLTNGDAPAVAKKGMIDFSPAVVDNLIRAYTGGAGTTITDLADIVGKAFTGDFKEIETREVPVIKAFVASPSDKTANYRLRTRYYKKLEEAQELKQNVMRAAKDKSDPANFAWAVEQANSVEFRKAMLFDKANGYINKINKLKNNMPKTDPNYDEMTKWAEHEKAKMMEFTLMITGEK